MFAVHLGEAGRHRILMTRVDGQADFRQFISGCSVDEPAAGCLHQDSDLMTVSAPRVPPVKRTACLKVHLQVVLRTSWDRYFAGRSGALVVSSPANYFIRAWWWQDFRLNGGRKKEDLPGLQPCRGSSSRVYPVITSNNRKLSGLHLLLLES
ncbi:hypothetical protein ElyMa_000043900 [Elysia marginata]|uniref:Uncharacterized protein n=1 Tax=Elysia marginata TaxID=1093978 RepID=A0AAV4EE50_9GAST|nr:hypothetical protein ElyMa_000043900 [Elysia marginata]